MRILADYGERGLVEATRSELEQFFPPAITSQLPEGTGVYAWGGFQEQECDLDGQGRVFSCPTASAFAGAEWDDLCDQYGEEMDAYDAACLRLVDEGGQSS